jgi:hypothetical protein
MKISRPSPAMVIACISLFVALGGSSLAAVNFARNAGAVDGKSAVASSTLLTHAAGKLVATASAGPDKGRLPGKFLADVPHTQVFGHAFDVADNAPGAPQTIGLAGTVGSLTATCNDQNVKAGIEDPITTLSFVNSSGATINVARRVGVDAAVVSPVANQTLASLTIAGSNTFTFQIEYQGLNVRIDGVVRQDGRGSPVASCLVYGTVLQMAA